MEIAPQTAAKSMTLPAAMPDHPDIHTFDIDEGPHLLVVDGSRIYAMPDELHDNLASYFQTGDGPEVDEILGTWGLIAPRAVTDAVPYDMPVRALSLAIAQKCNLGCTYCYASGGDFGGPLQNMSTDVATLAVDKLLADTTPGERVNLAFLGGEPLVNRKAVFATTRYAVEQARQRDVHLGLSITTNGTLITKEDGQFFEDNGFAVTVSLDGIGKTHDQQRSFKGGAGSYQRIIDRVSPLLKLQKKMQISARVTVTPANLSLPETLDGLVQLGFHSVGFSPMLSAPTGQGEMQSAHLDEMLEQMIACSEQCEQRLRVGKRYPFSNLLSALQEIHKGTHRPYACGAGGAYLGVSAQGGLYACHRFVEDEAGFMGSLSEGIDRTARNQWLETRHVHFQEPCSSCWARYMCGGGCHHEVISRGRPSCNYIRGWLDHCLKAYVRLSRDRLDMFPQMTNSQI